MELTDEQYKQVLKYVDNEMDKTESAAFEVKLNENEKLNEEVELYKDIRLLTTSINNKIDVTESMYVEKEKGAADVEMLIKQARENWENRHEEDLKMKHGVFSFEKGNALEENRGRVKKLSLLIKFAAAAAILGVLVVSAILFFDGRRRDTKIAEDQKQGSPVVANKLPNIKELPQHNRTALEKKEDNSHDATESNRKKLHAENKPGSRSSQREIRKEVNPDALFADNFIADAIPDNVGIPLKTAITYYKTRSYNEAITAFENIDLGPVTRSEEGDSQELDKFYISYYKGVSYLGIDSVSKAIITLENAKSSDFSLQSKAQWYLALAYLKNRELEKAEKVLKELANSNYRGFRRKADKLLNALSKKELRQ